MSVLSNSVLDLLPGKFSIFSTNEIILCINDETRLPVFLYRQTENPKKISISSHSTEKFRKTFLVQRINMVPNLVRCSSGQNQLKLSIFCQVCQLLFGDYYFSVVLYFKVTKGINYARYDCIYCIKLLNKLQSIIQVFSTTQKCKDRSYSLILIIQSYPIFKISTLQLKNIQK